MSANLDPVRLGADMVGIVDHPVGQPQQALLDGFQVGRAHINCFPDWPVRVSPIFYGGIA